MLKVFVDMIKRLKKLKYNNETNHSIFIKYYMYNMFTL